MCTNERRLRLSLTMVAFSKFKNAVFLAYFMAACEGNGMGLSFLQNYLIEWLYSPAPIVPRHCNAYHI